MRWMRWRRLGYRGELGRRWGKLGFSSNMQEETADWTDEEEEVEKEVEEEVEVEGVWAGWGWGGTGRRDQT